METAKYKEIQLLAMYWKNDLKSECTLSRWYDGYKLRFPNGANVVQHPGSCGSQEGCVEFAGVDDDIDYSAIDFPTALNILKVFHDELSRVAEKEEEEEEEEEEDETADAFIEGVAGGVTAFTIGEDGKITKIFVGRGK